MKYLEIQFNPITSEEEKSFLIAELLQSGLDSFNEEENALLAYVSADVFKENILKDSEFLKNHPEINYTVKPLEDINWNKEWESNYQPITIAGKCHVRAPFHPAIPGMAYQIVIEPKMAFGTAHHETTRLMAEWLMEMDVQGKTVLDMGCGTGILAILANKMGAASVTGIDNDEWAWRNAKENFMINGIPEENVFLGDASMVGENRFDLILANINRNVLILDMNKYFLGLRKNGLLLLSGFYTSDINAVKDAAEKCGFHFNRSASLNNWSIIYLNK